MTTSVNESTVGPHWDQSVSKIWVSLTLGLTPPLASQDKNVACFKMFCWPIAPETPSNVPIPEADQLHGKRTFGKATDPDGPMLIANNLAFHHRVWDRVEVEPVLSVAVRVWAGHVGIVKWASVRIGGPISQSGLSTH